MRQKKGFVLRDVCGEKVVVGESVDTIDFGKLIALNETATWIWEKAAELGDFTAEQLADALCEEYDVEKAKALHDIENTLTLWKETGLLI
jgi:hypothetical protein